MPQRRAKPPASGNLPAHGRRILTAAYESAKARALEQGKSAKAAKRAASAQAWCAVKRSYYKKGAKWVKRKATLGKGEQPPGCKPLRRRKNPALSAAEREILKRLADKAEQTGDDWGTITAIDGYLDDPDDDRRPIEYLLAVDNDVDWNYRHVGDEEDPTLDKASAKRAHQQIADAIDELKGLRKNPEPDEEDDEPSYEDLRQRYRGDVEYENPYLGDAVELSQRRKYEEERSRWEKGGRRGPPPAPPRSRQRNPPKKRKRRPGPHVVYMEFDTPSNFRAFGLLASRYFDLGPDASKELGRPDPETKATEGWWLPSSPEASVGFLEVLRDYGGRVISSRPAPSSNPQKNPSRAASLSRRITGV